MIVNAQQYNINQMMQYFLALLKTIKIHTPVINTSFNIIKCTYNDFKAERKIRFNMKCNIKSERV